MASGHQLPTVAFGRGKVQEVAVIEEFSKREVDGCLREDVRPQARSAMTCRLGPSRRNRRGEILRIIEDRPRLVRDDRERDRPPEVVERRRTFRHISRMACASQRIDGRRRAHAAACITEAGRPGSGRSKRCP